MKRKLVIALTALVVLAGIIWGGTAIYAKVRNDRAPEALSLSTPSAGTTGQEAPVVEDLAGTWTVADGSQAGYRVDEVLSGQDVTVVAAPPTWRGPSRSTARTSPRPTSPSP